MVLPSYVISRIREEYSKLNEVYAGYKNIVIYELHNK